ncbi:hypothetical protein HanIR_Chr08g0350731 [Helianthus annuus]|nr:hypothetical protein HanIR_Chr08g0350731 [Helianthus annuus]
MMDLYSGIWREGNGRYMTIREREWVLQIETVVAVVATPLATGDEDDHRWSRV